jgi:hypothetical protein
VLITTERKDLRGLGKTVRRRLQQLQDTLDWSADDELADDAHGDALVHHDADDETDSALAELEFRVLDVLREDRVLSRRAIEIGALDEGLIELRGRVRSEEEAARAASLAQDVDGVDTVVNRLRVRPPRDVRRARRERREGADVRTGVVDPAEEGGESPNART